MRIKGILFDKDGTLIDFFSLWLYAARRVIPEFIRGNDLENRIRQSWKMCSMNL
mgnify:CR=1 FL=1